MKGQLQNLCFATVLLIFQGFCVFRKSHACAFFEQRGKVINAVVANLFGDLCEVQPPLTDESFCLSDTQGCEVIDHTLTDLLLEGSFDLGDTDTKSRRKGGKGDFFGIMIFQIVCGKLCQNKSLIR